MGNLRYDGVDHEIADNVAATLRPVLRAALSADADFSVMVFDASTNTNTGIFLGRGIPISIADEGGEADQDCIERWTRLALDGDFINLSCVDVGCDCVLRDTSAE